MTWPPDLAVRNSEHTNTTQSFFRRMGPIHQTAHLNSLEHGDQSGAPAICGQFFEQPVSQASPETISLWQFHQAPARGGGASPWRLHSTAPSRSWSRGSAGSTGGHVFLTSKRVHRGGAWRRCRCCSSYRPNLRRQISPDIHPFMLVYPYHRPS